MRTLIIGKRRWRPAWSGRRLFFGVGAAVRGLAAALIALVLAATVPTASAQEPGPIAGQGGVLVLDQERLFQGSEAAARISAEFEQATLDLAAENRQIEAELSAEELELTEARPGLEPEAFRALADAFDEKVQNLRAEQDAKERELAQRRDVERQEFLRAITPILAEIARERGALLIVDRRVVVLSADSIDITDEAIARIDAAFNEDPPVMPAPTPDPLPEEDAAPEDDGQTETPELPEPSPGALSAPDLPAPLGVDPPAAEP